MKLIVKRTSSNEFAAMPCPEEHTKARHAEIWALEKIDQLLRDNQIQEDDEWQVAANDASPEQLPDAKWKTADQARLECAKGRQIFDVLKSAEESLAQQYEWDPNRAVHLTGGMHPDMLPPLLLEIDRLEAQAPGKAVTVYIDSPGGAVICVDQLLSHFAANNINMVTVIPKFAASAAAILATFSDYAVAYPQARLVYHGGRLQHSEVTKEVAQAMMHSLEWNNEQVSRRVARQIFKRLAHRFSHYRDQLFEIMRELKQKNGQHEVLMLTQSPPLAAYIEFCCQDIAITPDYRKLLEECVQRIALLNNIRSQKESLTGKAWESTLGETLHEAAGDIMRGKLGDSADIKARRKELAQAYINEHTHLNNDLPLYYTVVLTLISLDHAREGEKFGIDRLLLDKVTEIYLEMRHFLQDRQTYDEIRQQALNYAGLLMNEQSLERLGDIFEMLQRDQELSQEDQQIFDKFHESVEALGKPLYFFALAIARTIQSNDFELTGPQAYKLGLIDEVKGFKLASKRAELHAQRSYAAQELRKFTEGED